MSNLNQTPSPKQARARRVRDLPGVIARLVAHPHELVDEQAAIKLIRQALGGWTRTWSGRLKSARTVYGREFVNFGTDLSAMSRSELAIYIRRQSSNVANDLDEFVAGWVAGCPVTKATITTDHFREIVQLRGMSDEEVVAFTTFYAAGCFPYGVEVIADLH